MVVFVACGLWCLDSGVWCLTNMYTQTDSNTLNVDRMKCLPDRQIKITRDSPVFIARVKYFMNKN